MSAAQAPWSGRRLHFVGVGGAGMSGYARAAQRARRRGRGSDGAESAVSRAPARRRRARRRAVGHRAENVPRGRGRRAGLLSGDRRGRTSSASPRASAASPSARARSCSAELSALRRTIAVAGTHGKTTTRRCSCTRCAAPACDPGWLVGGTVGGGLANAHWSEGEWLVVEADESDRSMLSLERRDRGADERRARPPRGLRLAGGAARGVPRVPRGPRARRSCGIARSCSSCAAAAELVAYDVQEPELGDGGSRFRWRGHEVALAVPGAHNALQRASRRSRRRGSRAPTADARGRRPRAASAAPGGAFSCSGGAPRGARVYDDYAHHPTEVAATLRRRAHARARAADRGLPAAPVLAHRVARRASSGARSRPRTWWSCSTSMPRASAPRSTRA